MNELIFSSATTLAQAIRDREISSEELVKAYLARIEAANPQINAVVQLRAEGALAEARAYDAALARGQIKGPLHGVPMTVKDSLETAGVISTSGTVVRADFVPTRDAVPVARMQAAGAIMLGKTNLPELLMGLESDNLIYGRTNNPFDLTRTCGGSSGGEAAAQAAGFSAIGLGSDTGGSVRIPAHFCGVAGIKPTTGRVARTGQFPPYGGLTDRMSQVGILARKVEDLVLGLPLISGVDWQDQSVVPMPLGDPRSVGIKGLRVSFHTDNGLAAPTPETVAAVQAVARLLADAGAGVEEKRPPALEETLEIALPLLVPEGGNTFPSRMKPLGLHPGNVSPLLLGFIKLRKEEPSLTIPEIVGLMARWDRFRATMLGFIQDYDVIISPACAGPAMRHGETLENIGAFSYAMTYNLTGWPVVIVRAGTSPEGLPIAVQVIAQPWREDVALAVAQHIESQLPFSFPAW
ncbi:MAG: Amidase [Chloroflexi bacterium]|jgi:amidase|nr:Amidase [Chloroflexota bacterium]